MLATIPAPFHLFFILAVAWFGSLLGTGIALVWLRRLVVMDTPSARSNHAVPVPRGGGVAMVAAALLSWGYYGADMHVILAASALAAVSFADDLRGLPVRLRLAAQLAAVAVTVPSLSVHIFPASVPPVAEWVLIALAWIWFINLTNFMDGIDGITSMQTITVCLGICLVAMAGHAVPVPCIAYASTLAAAVLGFYWFNRHPAPGFMGEVGSITLGFLRF